MIAELASFYKFNHRTAIKDVYRLAEKMEEEEAKGTKLKNIQIYDVLRGDIECTDLDKLVLLATKLASHCSVIKAKNKFDSANGQLLLHFVFVSPSGGSIYAEIQFKNSSTNINPLAHMFYELGRCNDMSDSFNHLCSYM